MRLAEALVSLPLGPEAISAELKSAIGTAVAAVVAARASGGLEGDVAEHIREDWDHGTCTWEAALAITAEPTASTGWANAYFHGWLFAPLLDAADREAPFAALRYPLVGVWEPTAGIAPFESDEHSNAFRACASGEDVRAAGSDGVLRPANQHIHKVDAYAGGDRASTIALYMEAGCDRETAEAAVIGDEAAAAEYHFGADSARVCIDARAGGSTAVVIAADLEPGAAAPRVQVTHLLVLPADGAAAAIFRRWTPSGGDTTPLSTACAEVAALLEPAGLSECVAQRLRAVLLPGGTEQTAPCASSGSGMFGVGRWLGSSYFADE